MKKLVRDRIPELSGKRAERVVGEEYKSYLIYKIDEEIGELSQSSLQHRAFPEQEVFRNSVKEEAADSITAIIALCNTHGLCWEEIEKEIKRKGKEKGGFGAGFVIEVEG